jgi:hypothetical protein
MVDVNTCEERIQKMQLAQLRREIASLFDTTDDGLRVKQQMLYRVPKLRDAGMKGRAGAKGDSGLIATHSASALLMLTAMLGYNRDKIVPAVTRLWESGCVTPTGNPIEGAETLGAVLTLLLQRSDVRGRLIHFELDRDIPHVSFVFGGRDILYEAHAPDDWQPRIDRAVAAGELARTFYAPYSPAEWKRRVDRAFRAGQMAHISRLPATTFDKVAALIDDQEEIA